MRIIVLIVRRVLMAKLVELWKQDRLVEHIDRLPIELSPRNAKIMGRCCIHKERAVWKYKSFPLLGFDMNDEQDELIPLSYYAEKALKRGKNNKENILCVIDEACSACVQVNYEVTQFMSRMCSKSLLHELFSKSHLFRRKRPGQNRPQ